MHIDRGSHLCSSGVCVPDGSIEPTNPIAYPTVIIKCHIYFSAECPKDGDWLCKNVSLFLSLM
jgi:hypothetical protein